MLFAPKKAISGARVYAFIVNAQKPSEKLIKALCQYAVSAAYYDQKSEHLKTFVIPIFIGSFASFEGKAIKENGATRISINPQTMSDDILQNIGRRHSVRQTVDAYSLARKIGFDNINMDLIAGLPGDTLENFKETVEQTIALAPDNVTVHTLSYKRAAYLSTDGDKHSTDNNTAEMVRYARKRLTENNIFPYYMYRQSKTVGNLENVGYARKGAECLYNVYIMDETHTILACGASAVTKLREPYGNKIDRVFNYKYPYEYISRFDEILTRKDNITKFYEKYNF